jgi:hypothetical protein
MVHFNRRRLPRRRLARPARPAPAPAPTLEPLDLPEENPKNGASTEFALPQVNADGASKPRSRQQDTTVQLPALRPEADPKGETEGGLSIDLPDPPRRLEFQCPCGTMLVATTETYDKHSRCAMCQTVLLLNLVYDPDRHSHEIVPFRVSPDAGSIDQKG